MMFTKKKKESLPGEESRYPSKLRVSQPLCFAVIIFSHVLRQASKTTTAEDKIPAAASNPASLSLRNWTSPVRKAEDNERIEQTPLGLREPLPAAEDESADVEKRALLLFSQARSLICKSFV